MHPYGQCGVSIKYILARVDRDDNSFFSPLVLSPLGRHNFNVIYADNLNDMFLCYRCCDVVIERVKANIPVECKRSEEKQSLETDMGTYEIV